MNSLILSITLIYNLAFSQRFTSEVWNSLLLIAGIIEFIISIVSAALCCYKLCGKSSPTVVRNNPSTKYNLIQCHYDNIKWKHFPRYWPSVRRIHRFPVNSPHKGQWRGALMFSLICVWINGWVNNREAGDWRRYRTHYDVIVMVS